jgi:hypothetical protein
MDGPLHNNETLKWLLPLQKGNDINKESILVNKGAHFITEPIDMHVFVRRVSEELD